MLIKSQKGALIAEGIFYCYIDDFYEGDGNEIKDAAIRREIGQYINCEILIAFLSVIIAFDIVLITYYNRKCVICFYIL